MPIFEYMCRACGRRFEKLVLSSSSTKKVKCPACGAEEAEKVISTFSTSSSTGGSGATSCGPTGG